MSCIAECIDQVSGADLQADARVLDSVKTAHCADSGSGTSTQATYQGIEDGAEKICISPKQFDFARNWRTKVKPHLQDPLVNMALHFGMSIGDRSYKPGDAPWQFGRGPLNGQRPKTGSLSWYQPWGCCHGIAPFSWALGMAIYPDLQWGFLSSDRHTVAIGCHDQWEQPAWVMDILGFQSMTAEESLAFAKGPGWKFHGDFIQYIASFSKAFGAAVKALGALRCKSDTESGVSLASILNQKQSCHPIKG